MNVTQLLCCCCSCCRRDYIADYLLWLERRPPSSGNNCQTSAVCGHINRATVLSLSWRMKLRNSSLCAIVFGNIVYRVSLQCTFLLTGIALCFLCFFSPAATQSALYGSDETGCPMRTGTAIGCRASGRSVRSGAVFRRTGFVLCGLRDVFFSFCKLPISCCASYSSA